MQNESTISSFRLAYGCDKEALDINSIESINEVTQVINLSFFHVSMTHIF